MLMRALLVHIAHETSGAARIRHSLRPLIGEGGNYLQASGASRRGNANARINSLMKMESRKTLRVPDAVQRGISALTRVFDALWLRRAGTHKVGPGVAVHHDASASRCTASGA